MNSHQLLRKQVTAELKKRRLIFLTIAILSLLYLVISFTFGETGLLRYLRLRETKSQLVRELHEVETQNSRLQSDTKRLRENPFYLEKHARENFGMAKPDEYVFKYEQ
ncbi:MAG TPA: septum formation initiator family protein [Thermodesulfovibrionales bacterium]|nr:septum formation initiator family protein [Thermodesulfovibrionales bacterium]